MPFKVVDNLLKPGNKEALAGKIGVIGVSKGNPNSHDVVVGEITLNRLGDVIHEAEVKQVYLEFMLAQGMSQIIQCKGRNCWLRLIGVN